MHNAASLWAFHPTSVWDTMDVALRRRNARKTMKSYIFSVAFALLVGLAGGGSVWACPFCSVESQTLSEETRGADAVVLAKLVKEAPANANPADPASGTATFQIQEVLHGQELLKDAKQIGVVFFGDSNPERTYL